MVLFAGGNGVVRGYSDTEGRRQSGIIARYRKRMKKKRDEEQSKWVQFSKKTNDITKWMKKKK